VSLLGINLSLLMGRTIARPAPLELAEALKSVSVTNNDTGRSGFSLTFEVGRAGPVDLLDYALLSNPLLKPFTRVVLVLTMGVVPQVLADGVITNVQLTPSNEPGASTLTVTGEDVSVMMDLHEIPAPWPTLADHFVVALILLKYAQFGIVPAVIPAVFSNPKSPTDEIPVQEGSDFAYVNFLASRQGYVFYVEPGFAPNTNFAYWGPPHVPPPYRLGQTQQPITFNTGPDTNAASVNFSYNALAPTLLAGVIQDSKSNFMLPVVTSPRGLRIPLAKNSAIVENFPNVRIQTLPTTPKLVEKAVSGGGVKKKGENGGDGDDSASRTVSGVSMAEAFARAQATTDLSTDDVVTVSGELDALQYGEILRARGIVSLRGVGFTYGGDYYVKSVSHEISVGQYKQRFTLTREGTGSRRTTVRTS
jgi:hypothetical protein